MTERAIIWRVLKNIHTSKHSPQFGWFTGLLTLYNMKHQKDPITQTLLSNQPCSGWFNKSDPGTRTNHWHQWHGVLSPIGHTWNHHTVYVEAWGGGGGGGGGAWRCPDAMRWTWVTTLCTSSLQMTCFHFSWNSHTIIQWCSWSGRCRTSREFTSTSRKFCTSYIFRQIQASYQFISFQNCI